VAFTDAFNLTSVVAASLAAIGAVAVVRSFGPDKERAAEEDAAEAGAAAAGAAAVGAERRGV
jgi:hypothetical protein